MDEKNKERRCKSCGKLLIGEKLPFCRRCTLEGRNKAGHIGVIVTGAVTMALGAKTLNDNNSNNNDSVS